MAGVCQEIGLVDYFDRFDDQVHARVSLGQAVLAMVLNGLGFSNRRLHLVPQYFQYKPIERLIGSGITPDDLNDDYLGRALDWLTAHALTALWPIKVQNGSGVGLELGLHISRAIIEQHHGQVGVESLPAQGSTFWFTLPLTCPQEVELPQCGARDSEQVS